VDSSEGKCIDFSIVLITYRRDEAILENLSVIKKLVTDDYSFEVVVVDNNGDNVSRREYFESGGQHIKYIMAESNLGVAGGRNLGIVNSLGKYLLFLDDDALLLNNNVFHDIYECFTRNPRVAILAAKSINFYTKELTPEEFPHAHKGMDPDHEFLTYRFIGVAHAVRRELFDKVSGYDAEFFYGMEEFDLSFQAIKIGLEIMYLPSLVVEHKKLPSGRIPPAEAWERQLVNKIKVSYWHLPLRYFLSVFVVWSFYVLVKSRFRVNIFRSYMNLVVSLRNSSRFRQSMPEDGLRYLKSVGAPLWK
jgi:GT2 family glycosyltransferase